MELAKRAALLLIDMQWGFIDERSSLCIAGARDDSRLRAGT